MRIADLLKDDLFCLPLTQPPKEDFKIFAFKHLDSFYTKLEQVASDTHHFEDLSHYPLERIVTRQKRLIGQIQKMLDAYYDGKPYAAYSHLADGLVNDSKDFRELLNIKVFSERDNFYRIRVHKENFALPAYDFFHIPFEKRGLVKTQRFSIPGFPSLYLSSSIYVCWEEMNRPNLNDFQAVRLETKMPLSILDLSPPKSNASPYELYRYLMIWPLVMACSVCVRNYHDTFKPEYIIPQLLLQWVRESAEVDGICYQTTHMSFKGTLAKGDFFNLVLPVKDKRTRGLCNQLKNKFAMTPATSIQLSQCAADSEQHIYLSGEQESLNERAYRIEMIPGQPSYYGFSVLGGLERSLNKLPALPIGQHQEELIPHL